MHEMVDSQNTTSPLSQHVLAGSLSLGAHIALSLCSIILVKQSRIEQVMARTAIICRR